MTGKAVITIPCVANVEAIRISATDDRTSRAAWRGPRPQALAFAQRVAEHDDEKGQGLQRLDSKSNSQTDRCERARRAPLWNRWRANTAEEPRPALVCGLSFVTSACSRVKTCLLLARRLRWLVASLRLVRRRRVILATNIRDINLRGW